MSFYLALEARTELVNKFWENMAATLEMFNISLPQIVKLVRCYA